MIILVKSQHIQMDWTNGQVLNFVRLYEKHPLLWNTKHPDHKNRDRMCQAWLNIRDELAMDLDVADIKRKKESILATYRTLKKKVLTSQQSNNKDVYKPTWFAFSSLEKFLKDKNSLLIEDNIVVDDDPDDETYEDYVELPESHELAPHRFYPRTTTGCLCKPYSRRNRELKVYEELRKKKLQLEVRKLEIEVKEKNGETSQTAGESQAFERLRKRKLELEVRKLELDVWEHEEILGVKHTKLTNTVERVNGSEILRLDFSKRKEENHNNNSVVIDHPEFVGVEVLNNGSVNNELSEIEVDCEISENMKPGDHNYGSVM